MSSSEGALRIPKFDGKREAFPVWFSQFNALCAVKGVSEALKPGFDMNLADRYDTVLNVTIASEKAQAEAKKKNDLAMSFLTLAMDSNQLLTKVEAAKTVKWPDGIACVLMEKLTNKYKPKDNLAIAEQQKKLMTLHLKKEEDPEELGDKIAALETTYGNRLDEKLKVAAIVNAAGKDYGDVIREVTWRLENAGTPVEADVLIEAMSVKWRISGGHGKSSDDYVLETSLAVAPFKYNCYVCGKQGHKGKDCPNRQDMKACSTCGQKGHPEKFCWEKEENASKRPSGWKSKLESNTAALEVLLASVDMNYDYDYDYDNMEPMTVNVTSEPDDMTGSYEYDKTMKSDIEVSGVTAPK